MKKHFLWLSIFLIVACNDGGKSSNDTSSTITISGQKFDNPEAEKLNSLGIEKAKKGKNNSANKLFFEALEIEPQNPVILSNIGISYRTQGKTKKAISFYKKSLIASDSTYLLAACNLGYLYNQIGAYQKGIEVLNFAIANSKENKVLTIAHLNRIYIHLGLGKCEQAKSDLNFVKSSNSLPEQFKPQIEPIERKIRNCTQS